MALNMTNAISWRTIKNRKAATPVDKLLMPDYLAFTTKPKFWTLKNILIAAGICIFFLLAVGIAGHQDLIIQSVLNQ